MSKREGAFEVGEDGEVGEVEGAARRCSGARRLSGGRELVALQAQRCTRARVEGREAKTTTADGRRRRDGQEAADAPRTGLRTRPPGSKRPSPRGELAETPASGVGSRWDRLAPQRRRSARASRTTDLDALAFRHDGHKRGSVYTQNRMLYSLEAEPRPHDSLSASPQWLDPLALVTLPCPRALVRRCFFCALKVGMRLKPVPCVIVVPFGRSLCDERKLESVEKVEQGGRRREGRTQSA